MRYYLNIPLPNLLEREIASIEEQWQGSSKSAPHLTIAKPGTLVEYYCESDLIERIEARCSEIKPFTVNYGDVDYFNGRSTIYLKVEATPELMRCHSLLSLAVDTVLEPNGRRESLYIPHITLANHLRGTKSKAAWQVLSRLTIAGSFVCNGVNLLRMDGNDKSWQPVGSFSFQKMAVH